MSSKNISDTFTSMPDVKSAEKLLHEHKVEATTSFIMYYSYGVYVRSDLKSQYLQHMPPARSYCLTNWLISKLIFRSDPDMISYSML